MSEFCFYPSHNLNSTNFNKKITDESLKKLKQLSTINLGYFNNTITDESVELLTNLTSLNLNWNNNTITDKSFEKTRQYYIQINYYLIINEKK